MQRHSFYLYRVHVSFFIWTRFSFLCAMRWKNHQRFNFNVHPKENWKSFFYTNKPQNVTRYLLSVICWLILSPNSSFNFQFSNLTWLLKGWMRLSHPWVVMTHPSPVCSAFPPFLTGYVQVNSAGCQTVFLLLALHKNDPAFLFYGQKSLDLISRGRQNRNGRLNSKFVEIIVIYWMSVQEHGRKDQTVLSRTDDLSLKTRPPPPPPTAWSAQCMQWLKNPDWGQKKCAWQLDQLHTWN